jgi:hypothetical protein
MASYITVTRDTNRRKYPNTETTLTVNVYDSDALATPGSITGEWRIGEDNVKTSMTLTESTTGIYTAPILPEYSGMVHYKIKTTTPNLSVEGTYLVEPTHFDNVSTKDYGS